MPRKRYNWCHCTFLRTKLGTRERGEKGKEEEETQFPAQPQTHTQCNHQVGKLAGNTRSPESSKQVQAWKTR
ncbi:hypothetical protein MC885_008093 [Smutsia gigantea]|nr:hypothetical protein MC885_008093 [Smutsia gigantea]